MTGARDRASVTRAYAEPIAELILARSGGRRFERVEALRQWIRIEFGVPIRAELACASEMGRIERRREDDVIEIVFNASLPAFRQKRVLIHELAEWIGFTGNCLAGRIDDSLAVAASDAAAFRHEVAVAVEEIVAREWGFDCQPSSFTAYDRLRIAAPHGACPDRYTVGSGKPDTTEADPFDDACL